jgi:hypothetical protein
MNLLELREYTESNKYYKYLYEILGIYKSKNFKKITVEG